MGVKLAASLCMSAMVAIFACTGCSGTHSDSAATVEAAGTESASTKEASSTKGAATDSSADHAQAKVQAVANAKAAGKEVFTGTIRVFETDDDMASYQGVSNPFSGYSYEGGPYAVLVLDGPQNITASNGGGWGARTDIATLIQLAAGDNPATATYRSYNGQHGAVAVGSMWWQSEVGLPMGEPRAQDGTLMFTDTSDVLAVFSDAGTPGADHEMSSSEFILPDSGSHIYSVSELQPLSKHELTLARNEIFARYGRGFNDPDIRQYFESKSWYRQRYTADEFDALLPSPLSPIEQQNVDTILEVENSK